MSEEESDERWFIYIPWFTFLRISSYYFALYANKRKELGGEKKQAIIIKKKLNKR